MFPDQKNSFFVQAMYLRALLETSYTNVNHFFPRSKKEQQKLHWWHWPHPASPEPWTLEMIGGHKSRLDHHRVCVCVCEADVDSPVMC